MKNKFAPIPVDESTIHRFWDKVDQQSQCWLWTGALQQKGYGTIMLAGFKRRVSAHRFSWVLHKGQIPNGLCVCHSCDVAACVNPEHLFVGSYSDNMLDASAKGRLSPQKHPEKYRGENSKRARITDDVVREMRRLSAVLSQRAIAARLEVSKACVQQVLSGRTWRHVA